MKYLKTLDINLSFEEIAKLSDSRFKKQLKENSKIAAFKYLNKEKSKQKKIMSVKQVRNARILVMWRQKY